MARAKRQSTKKSETKRLEEALTCNGLAISEGPNKKSWTLKDLKLITPKTVNQENVFHDWYDGNHIVMYGFPGTGKTLISCYLALEALFRKEVEKIVIIRSTVQVREMGFLKGSEEEKIAVFEQPYRDVFYELLGRKSSYDDLKKAGKVEFESTAFLRGRTIPGACIVADEIQNYKFTEINTVMSRIGEDTRIIAMGDFGQNDLTGRNGDISGMERFMKIIQKMPSIQPTQFTRNDILRSGFVKEWIIACEETN